MSAVMESTALERKMAGIRRARGSACLVVGCPNPQHAKGYCSRHYGIQWRGGDPSSALPECVAPVSEEETEQSPEHVFAKLGFARKAYDNARGLDARMRMRTEVKELEELYAKLTGGDGT